jgi:hypothetical protein
MKENGALYGCHMCVHSELLNSLLGFHLVIYAK